MMTYEAVKYAASYVVVPMGPNWAAGLAVLHAMYNVDRTVERTVTEIYNSITPFNNTHDINAIDSVIRDSVSSGDFICIPYRSAAPMYAMAAKLRAAIDLEIELSQARALTVVEEPVVIFGMKYSHRKAEKINTMVKNYLNLYDEGMIPTNPAGLKIGKFFIDLERLKTLTVQLDRYFNHN